MTERDSYKNVGQAMRASHTAARRAEPPLEIHHWVLLSVIHDKTAAFSRLEEGLSNRYLADLSGMSIYAVRLALGRLAKCGAIRQVAHPKLTRIALPEPLLAPDEARESTPGNRAGALDEARESTPGNRAGARDSAPWESRGARDSAPWESREPRSIPRSSSEKTPSAANGAGVDLPLSHAMLWNALADELGGSPHTTPFIQQWLVAVRELAGRGATPEQVRIRCDRYRQQMTPATLTPMSLAKHWGSLGEETADGRRRGFEPYQDAPIEKYLEGLPR